MPKPKNPIKYPPNVYAVKGWLYFRKNYNGVKYQAALNLRDTVRDRGVATNHPEIMAIKAAMAAKTFQPNHHPLLAEYHTASGASIPTFEEYADQWLEEKKVRIEASTYRTYRDLIIPLKLYFGNHTLDKIDRKRVNEWLAKKKPKEGERGLVSLNDQLRRLKSIMAYAAEDFEGVTYNLSRCTALTSSAINDPLLGKNAFFTIEELDKLYWKAKERLRCMMLTSFFAGLRTGELCTLRRDTIDFEAGTLRSNSIAAEGGVIKKPKTPAGYRTIQMHPVLASHLKNYLNTHDSEFVFVSERGNRFTVRQAWEREFKAVKTAAGVRDLRWYGLRKAFATYKFACSDAVPASIASEMGHSDVSMTLNKYAQKVTHLGIKWDEIEFPLDRPVGPNVVEFSNK